LNRFAASLHSELRLALVALDRAHPDPDKVGEHQRLIDLAAAGDADGLAAAVTEHLETAAPQARAVFDRAS
jgi:DNA-binding GntR family transcriptional regulator